MSDSPFSNTVPLLAVAALRDGRGLLVTYPAYVGRYTSYLSATKEVANITDAMVSAIADSGLNFVERNFAAPALTLDSPYFSRNFTSNLGNSATVAEAQQLAAEYGSRFNYSMNLDGIPGNYHLDVVRSTCRMAGIGASHVQPFQPDLSRRSQSPRVA